MLQMRDPNTFSVNASGNYSGALIGANNLDADGIPTEYLGYAPYPVISEVGFSCLVGYQLSGILRVAIFPIIELYNPYPFDFIFKSGYPRIMVSFRNFSFDINYTYNGITSSTTINNTTCTVYNSKAFCPSVVNILLLFNSGIFNNDISKF